jgi:hypothetical protein
MALQLSLKRFLPNLSLELLFGLHLLQALVLGFQFLKTLHHGNIHAAKFSSPFVNWAELIPSSRNSSLTVTCHPWSLKITISGIGKYSA